MTTPDVSLDPMTELPFAADVIGAMAMRLWWVAGHNMTLPAGDGRIRLEFSAHEQPAEAQRELVRVVTELLQPLLAALADDPVAGWKALADFTAPGPTTDAPKEPADA